MDDTQLTPESNSKWVSSFLFGAKYLLVIGASGGSNFLSPRESLCPVCFCCPFPLDNVQPLWPLQGVVWDRREGLEVPSGLWGQFPVFQARGHCGLGGGFRVFREAVMHPTLLLNQWEVAGEEGGMFLPS